jgi:hypothetical protein
MDMYLPLIINNGPWQYIGHLVMTAVIILTAGCIHPEHTQMMGMAGMSHNHSECPFTPSVSVHCGRTPTADIDRNGRLWVAFVVGEHVYVSHSDDMGENYSAPVQVNRQAEEIYTNGENRAKLAFGHNGEIYVSWTVVRDGPFAGDIRFSRSRNGGRSFEAVRTVNDDGLLTSHRFETLFVDSRDNIYLAWLDKRDMVAANTRGSEYDGAAVYYTVSNDSGRTFSKNLKIGDYSCECCRIAMSETQTGDVALFWRHIFDDSIRDHGFAVISPEKISVPMQRATVDNWRIEACPHHGPAMVTGTDGTYHLTWFTLGDRHKGILYGRYNPDSNQMSDMVTVASAGSSHPDIERLSQTLYLVWKQFDGEQSHVMLQQSDDIGANWTAPESVVSTLDASDHPLLIKHEEKVLLSWHTRNEGLRIIQLNNTN